MIIDTPMDFDSQALTTAPSSDSLPIFFSNFAPGPQSLPSSGSHQSYDQPMVSMPTSHTPLLSNPAYTTNVASCQPPMPNYSISDSEVILIGQSSWSAYRCTIGVPASACPKTARFNLEKLKETFKHQEAWTNWRPAHDESKFAPVDGLDVASLQEMPRDKLLAITQTFLHKALEIHSNDSGTSSDTLCPKESSSFVILPPTRVLDSFLKSYANSFERFYPLIPRGTFDPNALMYQNNDKASSLLLLLMIAQGALISSSVDGRWLTGGLTEACRISLFDLIEKNIMMSGDAMVLHSALIFTIQAGWSGDKWQMDIAMGQRGMYFAMLRHSGYLHNERQSPATASRRSDLDLLWGDWIWHESRSRYA